MSATRGNVDLGLLVLRLGLGLLFVFVHGAKKFFGGPSTWAQVGGAMQHLGIAFAPAFWGLLAASAELLGGICLILGLFTRPAAILMTLTMAVAAIMHLAQGDGLGVASHAIKAGVALAALALTGPGRYSLAEMLSQRSPSDGSRYTLPG